MSGALTLREEVARYLSEGMDTPSILDRLRGRASPASIKTTLCHMRKMLGIKPERGFGKPRLHFAYVRLDKATDAFLRSEAEERGLTTAELATRILDKVAADALVDAVLDDGGGP